MRLFVSYPSDMWAFGCILIELFLGVPLFTGTPHEMIKKISRFIGPPPEYILKRSSLELTEL